MRKTLLLTLCCLVLATMASGQNARIFKYPTQPFDLSVTTWAKTHTGQYAGLLSDHSSTYLGNTESLVLYDSTMQVLWGRGLNIPGWGFFKLTDLKVGFNNEILVMMYGSDTRDYLIRYRLDGSQVFTKRYRFSDNDFLRVTRILPISHTEYLLLGGLCLVEDFVIKTDTLGNILWSKEYDAWGDALNRFVDGVQVDSNNFCLLGDDKLFSLINIDKEGAILQKKVYNYSNIAVSMVRLIQDAEHNLYVLGTQDTSNYVFKLNDTGQLVWARRLQHQYLDKVKDIAVLPGGDILISSSMKFPTTVEYEGIVYLLNAQGDLQWAHSSATQNDGQDFINGMLAEPDGKLVVGAVSVANGPFIYQFQHFNSSFPFFCEMTEVDLEISDITSSVLSINTTVQVNTIDPQASLAGVTNSSLGDFQTTIDCQYDLDGDGLLSPADCDDTNANAYPGAVEIPNNGLDEDCDGSDLIVSQTNQIDWESKINLWPNPATTTLSISCDCSLDVEYRVFNFTGQLEMQGRDALIKEGVQIPVATLHNGMHLLTIRDIQTGRLLKLPFLKN